jgi:hypothetical protein
MTLNLKKNNNLKKDKNNEHLYLRLKNNLTVN